MEIPTVRVRDVELALDLLAWGRFFLDLDLLVGDPTLVQVAARFGLDQIDVCISCTMGIRSTENNGIALSHPFMDGNKRTAYVVCMLFLGLHGFGVNAPAPTRVSLVERLGKGEIQQEELAGWLREHGIAREI